MSKQESKDQYQPGSQFDCKAIVYSFNFKMFTRFVFLIDYDEMELDDVVPDQQDEEIIHFNYNLLKIHYFLTKLKSYDKNANNLNKG